jgi:methylphosphotriester-DNA--protein-cysteine methyltransferase
MRAGEALRAGLRICERCRLVTQKGANYSEDEYSTWLAKTGFQDVRHIALPGWTGLMVG